MASSSSLAVSTRSSGWTAAVSVAAASYRRKYSAAGTRRHSRQRVTVINNALQGRDDETAESAAGAAAAEPPDLRRAAPSCFACPLCAGAMIRLSSSGEGGARGGAGPTTLRCDANHSFDVSRDGVVNLMPARSRGGGSARRATGDSPDMLSARRRFLRAGHYREVSNRVNQTVLACVADVARGVEVAAAADSDLADCASEDAVGSESSEASAVRDDDDRKASVAAADSKGQGRKLTPRQRRLATNMRNSKSAKAQSQLNRALEEGRRRNSQGDIGARVSSASPPLVVDFGCGEGWWLEQVVKAAAAAAAAAAADDDDTTSTENFVARFAAFDASPDAARMAAKLLKTSERANRLNVSDLPTSPSSTSATSMSEAPVAVEVAVADAQSDALPFLSGSVAAALSVFAPRNPRELHRVVVGAAMSFRSRNMYLTAHVRRPDPTHESIVMKNLSLKIYFVLNMI